MLASAALWTARRGACLRREQTAASYPAKTIRIIVPFTPGGGNDISARFIAQQLTQSFKQSVIVENRPGAGSTVGTDMVAKSPPDGYTLMVIHNAIAINQTLYAKLPYDAVRDFAQVALVLDALRMAYGVRKPEPGLIFYSDRGSQYASADVRKWLLQKAMRQSMSGTGNCFDNAPMESFWHSPKVEETHGQDFATRDQAKHCVLAYIEGWYNTTRMHSSLGYKSPTEFERDCDTKSIKAANDSPISAPTNNSQSARLTKRAA